MSFKIWDKWYQYQAKCFHLSRRLTYPQNSVEQLMRMWSLTKVSELGSTQRYGEIFKEGSDLFCSLDWSLVQFFLQCDTDGNDFRLVVEYDDTENLQPLCYKLFPYWNTDYEVVMNMTYCNASYWMCEEEEERERVGCDFISYDMIPYDFMGVMSHEIWETDCSRYKSSYSFWKNEVFICLYDAYGIPCRTTEKNLLQHCTLNTNQRKKTTIHYGVPLSHQLFNSWARWYHSTTSPLCLHQLAQSSIYERSFSCYEGLLYCHYITED